MTSAESDDLIIVTATNGGPAGIDELNSFPQRRHVTKNHLTGQGLG
jgi:hypothetical protein